MLHEYLTIYIAHKQNIILLFFYFQFSASKLLQKTSFAVIVMKRDQNAASNQE